LVSRKKRQMRRKQDGIGNHRTVPNVRVKQWKSEKRIRFRRASLGSSTFPCPQHPIILSYPRSATSFACSCWPPNPCTPHTRSIHPSAQGDIIQSATRSSGEQGKGKEKNQGNFWAFAVLSYMKKAYSISWLYHGPTALDNLHFLFTQWQAPESWGQLAPVKNLTLAGRNAGCPGCPGCRGCFVTAQGPMLLRFLAVFGERVW